MTEIDIIQEQLNDLNNSLKQLEADTGACAAPILCLTKEMEGLVEKMRELDAAKT